MTPRPTAVRWPRALGFHAAALAVAAVFLVPGLWVLAASLRQPGLPPPATIEWLPHPLAWSNYARIFEVLPLGRYLANSLPVAGLAVPLTIVVASWAGFAMAQLPPRARYALLALAVMVRMVPLTAVWLTRFLVLRELGLSPVTGARLLALGTRRVDGSPAAGHATRTSTGSTSVARRPAGWPDRSALMAPRGAAWGTTRGGSGRCRRGRDQDGVFRVELSRRGWGSSYRSWPGELSVNLERQGWAQEVAAEVPSRARACGATATLADPLDDQSGGSRWLRCASRGLRKTAQ